MNQSRLKLSAVVLASLLFAAPAFAKKSGADADGAGTVNGKPVPQNQVDFFVSAQKAQGRPDSPELKKAVREHVIGLQLLVQEAQKQGIDKKPEIQAQMDLARQGVLIQTFVASYIKAHPVSEDAIKKDYDAKKAQLGDKEFKVRHILVESEGEANDIIAKLKKGEKFDSLAAQSKDPGSKDKGGDLGWATPSNYVKPFADAVLKLNKGQYTETPVKSDFGYHVIQLDDTRPLKLPSIDEAKPEIQNGLQQQMIAKLVADLRAKARVE